MKWKVWWYIMLVAYVVFAIAGLVIMAGGFYAIWQDGCGFYP